MEENQFVHMGFECPISVFIQAYTGEKNVEKAKQLIVDNDWFMVGDETIKMSDLDWMLTVDAWVECKSMQEIEFNGLTALELVGVYMDYEVDFACDVCDMPEFLKNIYELARQQ